jgi:hypothetical protein
MSERELEERKINGYKFRKDRKKTKQDEYCKADREINQFRDKADAGRETYNSDKAKKPCVNKLRISHSALMFMISCIEFF